MKKLRTLNIIFLSLALLIANPYQQVVSAETLQEQLDRLDRELKDIKAQKDKLQQDINSNQSTLAGYNSQLYQLQAEIAVYDNEVKELELQIKELEVNIQILEAEIDNKQKEIKKSENSINELEVESGKRIKTSYMNYRLYSGDTANDNLFNVDNINDYFKDSQYKELIQSETNKMMIELADLKEELAIKKKELDEKLVQVKKDKEIIDIKKVDVTKKKDELDAKMSAYYTQIGLIQTTIANTQNTVNAVSQQEITTNALAEQVRQQLFNSFNPINEGQYVVAGTIIGKQGSTGFSTGAHLHFMVAENGSGYLDPCGYLPGGVVGGCGWGNRLQWPLKSSITYTSGYGNRCFWYGGAYTCDFHSGADFVGSPWNAPVYATHNGYLYKGVDWYGALYVIICENTNCNSGIKTAYWHLSER